MDRGRLLDFEFQRFPEGEAALELLYVVGGVQVVGGLIPRWGVWCADQCGGDVKNDRAIALFGVSFDFVDDD